MAIAACVVYFGSRSTRWTLRLFGQWHGWSPLMEEIITGCWKADIFWSCSDRFLLCLILLCLSAVSDDWVTRWMLMTVNLEFDWLSLSIYQVAVNVTLRVSYSTVTVALVVLWTPQCTWFWSGADVKVKGMETHHTIHQTVYKIVEIMSKITEDCMEK